MSARRDRKTTTRFVWLGAAMSFVAVALLLGPLLSREVPAPPPSILMQHQSQRRAAPLTGDQAIHQEHIALANIRQQRVVDRGTRVLRLVDIAIAEVHRWQMDIEPFLTNDQGKILAAEERFIEAFLRLYEASRPWAEEIDSLRERVAQLVVPPKVALDNGDPGYIPRAEVLQQLNTAEYEAREAIHAYRDPREQIQALFAGAIKVNTTPADVTLETAIADYLARIDHITADAVKATREGIHAADIAAEKEREAWLAPVRREVQKQRDRLYGEMLLIEREIAERRAEQSRLQAEFDPRKAERKRRKAERRAEQARRKAERALERARRIAAQAGVERDAK